MTTPRVSFIGCGRLGKTIARLLHQKNCAIINDIVTSSKESAIDAVKFIGSGNVISSINDLSVSDVYFIVVPDDKIESICLQLCENNLLRKNVLVVHCSGSLSSDILSKAKELHCFVASVHPIKSFANPKECIDNFYGTYCAIEGDVAAVKIITDLFQNIGGVIFSIKKENKSLYHAACVMANNYLVTLHYHANECLISSGVELEAAKKISSNLMLNAINNIDNLNHRDALTGPIKRGDLRTIQNHLVSLLQKPLTKDIYTILGIGTLPLSMHSEDTIDRLKTLLNSELKIHEATTHKALKCKL